MLLLAGAAPPVQGRVASDEWRVARSARHSSLITRHSPNVIGSLWTARQPGRLAIVTLPVTATVAEHVTAEIYQGVHNALTARGGTLVWLNYGDGAYEDAYW